jgi:hypothetical protein
MKKTLLCGVAMVALAMAGPSFAGQGVPGGDDLATITQIGETGGTASQHQPGSSGNQATIIQSHGHFDVATQEQFRNLPGGVDFAIKGKQTIHQGVTTGNNQATASQEDNSFNGVQTITQDNNLTTSATQTINNPFGGQITANKQTSTQTGIIASSVSQLIGGIVAPGVSTFVANGDAQTATQTIGENNSTIQQTMVVLAANSTNNVQNASEAGGSFNSITQLQDDGSVANNQLATMLNGNGNIFSQRQGVGSSNNHQTAHLTVGNGNVVTQEQEAGAFANTQLVTINASNNGRALQWQGPGITLGQQTILQDGGGNGNQAGQAQGNSSNVASITQTGGSGNVALQNQGLLPGTGFMHVVGTTVTRTP